MQFKIFFVVVVLASAIPTHSCSDEFFKRVGINDRNSPLCPLPELIWPVCSLSTLNI